jgi:hypothetical protein
LSARWLNRSKSDYRRHIRSGDDIVPWPVEQVRDDAVISSLSHFQLERILQKLPEMTAKRVESQQVLIGQFAIVVCQRVLMFLLRRMLRLGPC